MKKTTTADKVETAKTKPASSEPANSELAAKIVGDAQSTQKPEGPVVDLSSFLPATVADLYKFVEGKMEFIAGERDKVKLLLDEFRPLSKVERKISGKKSAPAYRRKASRLVKRVIEVGIKEAENEITSVVGSFNVSSDSERKLLDLMMLKLNSQSTSYISRNKKNLLKRIDAHVAKSAKRSSRSIRRLMEVANSNNKSAKAEFDLLFFELLKDKDEKLLVLCTGIESFKKDVWSHARSLFRSLYRQAR